MAVTLEELQPAPDHTKPMDPRAHSCPRCGTHVPDENIAEAQEKIRELEAQVEMLKEKATAAVDKCADYEDQLRSMKGRQNSLPRSNTFDSLDPSRVSGEDVRPSTASSQSANKSRFSFLTGRRGSPFQLQAQPQTQSHSQLTPGSWPSPSPPDNDLLDQLEKERAARMKAEGEAQRVNSEIEELSVQLFSQANEMVASERKARAKLEARVEQLEQKDKEKMARLERLEKAVTRIDRVKAMLAAPSPQRKS